MIHSVAENLEYTATWNSTALQATVGVQQFWLFVLQFISITILGFASGCHSGDDKVEGSPEVLAFKAQALVFK